MRPADLDDVVRSDQASVTSVFRADRYHQLASTGLDTVLSWRLADVQLRDWTLMLEDVTRPEYLALFVEDGPVDGPVAGTVVSRSRSRGRRIAWIGVHPDHRRRGYGRLLLQAICVRADDDAKRLEVQVDRTNLGALALCDDAGFRVSEPDQGPDQFLIREPCGCAG